MRDFRNAKAMAQTLRRALAAKGLKISNSDSLELIAQALGLRDWNTLSAMIRDEPAAPRKDQPPPDAPRETRATHGFFATFSLNLEETLQRAVDLANQRRHEYATPQHLLLALADDGDAAPVLRACAVDIDVLRIGLVAHLSGGSASIRAEDDGPAAPAASFQRIIQRAVIHVQTSGRGVVTGANVLVALFSEAGSHAFKLLQEQGMTRQDAVNFIAHGIATGGGAATT